MLPVRDSAIDRMWSDPFGRMMHRPLPRHAAFHESDEDGASGFPVDIREDGDAFHVDAELPGFDRDQIDITLQQDVLTITADAGRSDRAHHYLQQERATGTRRRVFRLTRAVDGQQIDAKYDNGVLHLTLPKRAEVRPRKIELKQHA